MKKNKKGFVFVETIMVTTVLLATLMTVYGLFITTTNTESRYTRYDDPAKLYESYYLTKYFQGFNFEKLIENIDENCNTLTTKEACGANRTCEWKNNTCTKQFGYELIWQGRDDILDYTKEAMFVDDLWNKLNIKNIYVIPSKVSEVTNNCSQSLYSEICANPTLVTYLKSLDDGTPNTYYVVYEYTATRSGTACDNGMSIGASCLVYYSYIKVGD